LDRRQFSSGLIAALPSAALASRHLHLQSTKASAQPAIRDAYEPAALSDITIGGLLGDRIGINLEKRLIEGVDLEVLLAGYRKRPGQHTWIGEHCGKFIDAATNTWVLTRNPELKAKLDYAVRELIATQEADGYLGTYGRAERWTDWDVWAHKYNLTGLLNYYAHTDYAPALAACRKMGDLLVETFAGQKRALINRGPHFGMASGSVLGPLVDLYTLTGRQAYLDLARDIVRAWELESGPKIFSTLRTAQSVLRVANGKAYEMLSCLVGAVQLHRVTGDAECLEAAEIAWEDLVQKRLYLTGTASWDEVFHYDHWLRADDAQLEAGVGEGCVTTTWMQLNLQLLRVTGEAKYADQLERCIYNALIAAQNPENGLISYFVALNGCKHYGEVAQGVAAVSCCTSSVPRGIALIPMAAFGVRKGSPAVNLYCPGDVRIQLAGKDVRLQLRTEFPNAGKVEITVLAPERQRFSLALRVPDWSRTFTARVAHESYAGVAGEYLEITRTWKEGDTVDIQLDLTPQVVSGAPSYPDHVAVLRGAQVLAVDQYLNPELEIWTTGLVTPPVFASTPDRLPQSWHHTQAYEVAAFEGSELLGKRAQKVLMVPISDAGRTGSEYRTWLKRS
jgi:uncharacterized protein